MTGQVGEATTAHASRYLQQLSKHWSHRFQVVFDTQKSRIQLPAGLVELRAFEDRLQVSISPAENADSARLRVVVAEHLDRFAFREAPLAFEWREKP